MADFPVFDTVLAGRARACSASLASYDVQEAQIVFLRIGSPQVPTINAKEAGLWLSFLVLTLI